MYECMNWLIPVVEEKEKRSGWADGWHMADFDMGAVGHGGQALGGHTHGGGRGRGSGARDGEESGMGRRMDSVGAAGRGPRRRGRPERRAMARSEASGRGALGRWGEGGVRGGRVRVRVTRGCPVGAAGGKGVWDSK